MKYNPDSQFFFSLILVSTNTVGIKEKKFEYRFIGRSDYCLNSNGEEFVNNLPQELQVIRENLNNLLVENHDKYSNYLSRDFNITDTLMQKDLRPELEEIGLPIIDI